MLWKQRSALNRLALLRLNWEMLDMWIYMLSVKHGIMIGDEALKPVLPNKDTTIYVVPVVAYQWMNRVSTKLRLKCKILIIYVDWNHDMVKSWGQYKSVSREFLLVNEAFVRKFP